MDSFTLSHIGNGFFAFIRNREQFEMLREDKSLLKSAVEDFLRYDPPVQRVSRAL
jgi:cytochrome P450